MALFCCSAVTIYYTLWSRYNCKKEIEKQNSSKRAEWKRDYGIKDVNQFSEYIEKEGDEEKKNKLLEL